MRPVFVVALLGTVLSVRPAKGQSTVPAEPDNADRGSKSVSSRPKTRESLFEGPAEPEVSQHPAQQKAVGEPPRESSGKQETQVPVTPLPTVQAVPPGPPQKNLTGGEFALIHIGWTTQEVLKTLGPPSSRVVVPDDDGHLRETLKYWVKGVPAATVRLDNGRVTQVETKQK